MMKQRIYTILALTASVVATPICMANTVNTINCTSPSDTKADYDPSQSKGDRVSGDSWTCATSDATDDASLTLNGDQVSNTDDVTFSVDPAQTGYAGSPDTVKIQCVTTLDGENGESGTITFVPSAFSLASEENQLKLQGGYSGEFVNYSYSKTINYYCTYPGAYETHLQSQFGAWADFNLGNHCTDTSTLSVSNITCDPTFNGALGGAVGKLPFPSVKITAGNEFKSTTSAVWRGDVYTANGSVVEEKD